MIHLNLVGEPLRAWQGADTSAISAPEPPAPESPEPGLGPEYNAPTAANPQRASTQEPAAIEAVLFDKDGTMSHSEPMLESLATARVFHGLEALDGQQIPERRAILEDLLRRAYGLTSSGIHPAGTTAVASREHNLISTATAFAMVGLGWPDALALSEEVFARTDALHGQGSNHKPQPTEGLAELLERFSSAGLRCAVISNDHEQGIHAFLAIHGLAHHFQAFWSAEHRPCKPHPGAVHGVCRELGVAADRCALIGDANSDLRMARAAGVPVVLGYRAGWKQPPPLDPDVPLIHHWRELTVGSRNRGAVVSMGTIGADADAIGSSAVSA